MVRPLLPEPLTRVFLAQVCLFSYQKYDHLFLVPMLEEECGKGNVKYLSVTLSIDTAPLAAGCNAVCIFVNDQADQATLKELSNQGVKLILNRCAGFNNVDLETASRVRPLPLSAHEPTLLVNMID